MLQHSCQTESRGADAARAWATAGTLRGVPAASRRVWKPAFPEECMAACCENSYRPQWGVNRFADPVMRIFSGSGVAIAGSAATAALFGGTFPIG